MNPFVMEIAGAVFCVRPMFQSTKEYCRPYLTEKQPDFLVEVTPEDLVYEQKMLDIEADEEGLKRRKFTEPFLERTAIQRKVADHLLSKNRLMVHGSTVAVDGKAYLFTGPCRTGKSTHTRLWRELFGQRAVMVNDDKPFLQISETGVLAYGSPWSGKHGLANNICVPLVGICLLHRGSVNVIQPISPEAAMETILHQTYVSTDALLQNAAHALVDNLIRRIPLWEMHCNKELDAAKVSYLAMCADQDKRWLN